MFAVALFAGKRSDKQVMDIELADEDEAIYDRSAPFRRSLTRPGRQAEGSQHLTSKELSD